MLFGVVLVEVRSVLFALPRRSERRVIAHRLAQGCEERVVVEAVARRRVLVVGVGEPDLGAIVAAGLSAALLTALTSGVAATVIFWVARFVRNYK